MTGLPANLNPGSSPGRLDHICRPPASLMVRSKAKGALIH
jgi:hypothetical protein